MANKYAKLLSIIRKSAVSGVVSRLSEARTKVSSEDFEDLLRAFRAASPAAASAVGRRIRAYEDLYWVTPKSHLDIREECIWASVWLKPLAERITKHVHRLEVAQQAFAAGRYQDLTKVADESVQSDGWSFWAAELKLASLVVTLDYASAKEKFAHAQKVATNRNSGLLLQMLLDRNDPALSSGSFRSKCRTFFKKIDHQSRSGLVRMRTVKSVESVEQLSWLMSWNLTSSYIDYYEDLITSLDFMRADVDLGVPRAEVRKMLSHIASLGIEDYRIEKLSLMLADVPKLSNKADTLMSDGELFVDQCHKMRGFSEPFFRTDPFDLNSALLDCEERGALASKSAEILIKFGGRFSCLPIAEGIEGKGYQRYYELTDGLLIPGGGALASRFLTLPQISALHTDQIQAYIDSSDDAFAQELRESQSLFKVKRPDEPNSLHVWLVLKLIDDERYDEANELLDHLSNFGSIWERSADKLRTKLEKRRNRLEIALDILVKWFLLAPEYEFEFPVQDILKGVTWRQVEQVAPWKVGLLANAAENLGHSSSSRYLCRKSCVKFYDMISSSSLDEVVRVASARDRKIIHAFLRRAWVDDNLTLVSKLPSPEDVRQSRMHVLQHLLTHDDERGDEYRQEIQELTLDETLWHGLRELDTNRIFVNEPAITRWAEKEFGEGYERFRVLQSGSEMESIMRDRDVRNYLIEGDVESLNSLQAQHSAFGLLLLPIFTGMFSRFMNDPNDGLNAYLSLRVRHGSLRGTLLGAAEEERILIVGKESEIAFLSKFSGSLPIAHTSKIVLEISKFSSNIVADVETLVNEIVQIKSEEKPRGAFSIALDESVLSSVLAFADPSWSFHSFASQCYSAFWSYLNISRNSLSEYILGEYRESCEAHFAKTIAKMVEDYGDEDIEPLLLSFQSSLTRMLASIEVASSWFVADSQVEERAYSIEIAFEIADKATRNVFPDFEINRIDSFNNCSEVMLSALGLSVVYDSLFVVLGNVWERSGLKGESPRVDVSVDWCPDECTLRFRIENALSESVKAKLESGLLTRLKARYHSGCVSDLVAVEGGSGFAKLSRISGLISLDNQSRLDFDLSEEGGFFVAYQIPLHRRGELYDAYL